MRFFVLGLLLFTAQSAISHPAEIIIIRHGEKPDDPNALHLSERGEERAKALVELFTKNPELTKHGPPAALFASAPTRHGHGQRPGETLKPLSKALQLSVRTPYPSEDYARLAHEILHNRAYKGKTVVICWVHEYIPQLAAALGVKPEPPKWKDHVFDLAYIITYSGGHATLDRLPQKLLPGDSEHKSEAGRKPVKRWRAARLFVPAP